MQRYVRNPKQAVNIMQHVCMLSFVTSRLLAKCPSMARKRGRRFFHILLYLWLMAWRLNKVVFSKQ